MIAPATDFSQTPAKDIWPKALWWGTGVLDREGEPVFWRLILRGSQFLFGEGPFGLRFPSALLCALTPVLLAQLIRRYYRSDIAFACGLLFACIPIQIILARYTGLRGGTITLLTAIVYVGHIIAIDEKRWAWIPLSLLAALVPHVYAMIRYMCLLIVPPIAYKMVASPRFRSRHD